MRPTGSDLGGSVLSTTRPELIGFTESKIALAVAYEAPVSKIENRGCGLRRLVAKSVPLLYFPESCDWGELCRVAEELEQS
jgi:hypothetical protein